MSQFGPLNRILIPVLRAPSSVPLQLFLTLPFSIRSSMDAITEKLFPILATPPHAAARLPSVFLSSVFISLVHYGKCDMAERGGEEGRGQLDNRGRGEVSCGSRVVARVKVWMAKVISPFLAAAAWIVFAFGRQNRMEIRNPLNDGQNRVVVNGPGASRRRPRRTRKISGQSALAPFACCTFLEQVLILQNSRPIASPWV